MLTVMALVVGVLVLAFGLFGAMRSTRFLSRALATLGDVGQIAPERVSVTSPSGSVAPIVTRAGDAATSSSRESARGAPTTTTGGASAIATSATGDLAGLANAGGGEDAQMGGGGGTSGSPASGSAASASLAGAAPSLWENVVQSTLALLGQATISMCGPNTCNAGQVCCNASCGTCVAPGASYDKTQCSGAPRTPTVVLCGATQCNDGQVCCNPSCGTCAAPGETCSQQSCQ